MLQVDEFLNSTWDLPRTDVDAMVTELLRLLPEKEQISLALRSFGEGAYPPHVERAILDHINREALIEAIISSGNGPLLGCVPFSEDEVTRLAWELGDEDEAAMALGTRYPALALPILATRAWASGNTMPHAPWRQRLNQWLVREPTAETSLVPSLVVAAQPYQASGQVNTVIRLYRAACKHLRALSPHIEAAWGDAFASEIVGFRLAAEDFSPSPTSSGWSESLADQLTRWSRRPELPKLAQGAMFALEEELIELYKREQAYGSDEDPAPNEPEFRRAKATALVEFLEQAGVSEAWLSHWREAGPLQEILVTRHRRQQLDARPATSRRSRPRS